MNSLFTRVFRALFVTLLVLLSVPASADWQTAVGVRVGETYSDNVARRPASEAHSDFSTEVSPWLSLNGRSARTIANIDARLQNWLHTDSRTANRSDLRLKADGRLEVYERHFYIDAGASKDRQQVSQLATPDAAYGASNNSTEVFRYRVAPSLQWTMGQAINGRLSYQVEKVETDKANLSGLSNLATLNLQNTRAFGPFGWSLDARHFDSSANNNQASHINAWSAAMLYSVGNGLDMRVFGGRENNDFSNGYQQKQWNWGSGLNWRPDSRTALEAETSRRFFGQGFKVGVSQRFPQSFVQLNWARDISSFSNTQNSTAAALNPNLSTTYQAAWQAALASVPAGITDPAQREAFALTLLQLQGIPVVVPVNANTLSAQTYIDRRLNAIWVLQGVRNTFTVSGFSSNRDTLSQVKVAVASGDPGLQDDLARFSRVRQHGWNVFWRHQLSGLSNFGFRYDNTQTRAYDNASLRSALHAQLVSLSFDTRLAPFTSGGLGVTHAWSSGLTDYRENAITMFLLHRF